MSHDKMKGLSLTERRKLETRNAIADAACDLFLKEGFDNVTVDSVAQESGVSLRTFYRYFESKEDVLAPLINDGMQAFVEAIGERPEGEDIGTAVVKAYAEMTPEGEDEEIGKIIGLMISIPALRARWLDGLRKTEEMLVPLVIERAKDKPTDLEAKLTAASIVLIIRLSVEGTVDTESHRSMNRDIASAIDYLHGGGGL